MRLRLNWLCLEKKQNACIYVMGETDSDWPALVQLHSLLLVNQAMSDAMGSCVMYDIKLTHTKLEIGNAFLCVRARV